MILPAAIVYAGLAGVLLALLVATATNGWQCRVFAILALRLAVGWYFLFAGLDKVYSFAVGPTDKNKVFSSEPYFAAAEGPLGEYMRKTYLGDPEATYKARLEKKKAVSATDFEALTRAQQAEYCPDWLLPLLEGSQEAAVAKATADKAKAITDKEKADADAIKAGADLKKAEGDKDAAKTWVLKPQAEAAKKKADDLGKAIKAYDERLKELAEDGKEGFARQKARYAGWLHGTESRDAKVNMVTGDVPLTADERLAAIALLERESAALAARDAEGLGRGYTYELDRKKKLKADLQKAKADLAADIEKFIDDLRADAGLPPREVADAKAEIRWLDKMTAYTITAVGAGLLVGLFTKLWCLVGFGFLAMTYAAHPTVPWLPLPPLTQGNPVFVNENIIMALGLLVVLVHPTGRWLGLDALLCRLIFGPPPADPTPPAAA